MDNPQLAAMFLEMGELLQIVGGDPHRARAFKRTAQILEAQRVPVRDALRDGRLDAIAGIGPGSVERIREMLRTGTCLEREKLLARIPTDLRALLKVRGMGARLVRVAHASLGVRNVDDLYRAAVTGQLGQLAGFGEAAATRVREALEESRTVGEVRLKIGDALDLGARIVAWLSEDPGTLRVAQTGSARRMKETVGDLDFVASTNRGRAVADRFVGFPEVKSVLMRGAGRSTVLLQSGVQADVRVIDDECFGAGVHHFTGGQPHNVALRLRANQRGLTMSEHGVFERVLHGKKGSDNRRVARRLVAGVTEEEIYASVGLPWVPPELREHEGELEAAEEHRLPTLLDVRDLKGDLHVEVATLPASALAAAAKTRGMQWLCLVWPHVDDEAALAARKRELSLLEERLGLRLLLGLRVPIDARGEVGVHAELAARADVVIGVPERVAGQTEEQGTARLERALGTGLVDVLAHATGRVLLQHEGQPLERKRVALALSRAETVLELSCEPDRLDAEPRLCRAAREAGARVALGTHARTPEEFARTTVGTGIARRGWLSPKNVVNTDDAAEVDAWLRARRRPRVAATTSVPARPLLEIAEPLDDAMVERLEAFLRGEADAPLEEALTARSGNALQSAFELLARAR